MGTPRYRDRRIPSLIFNFHSPVAQLVEHAAVTRLAASGGNARVKSGLNQGNLKLQSQGNPELERASERVRVQRLYTRCPNAIPVLG